MHISGCHRMHLRLQPYASQATLHTYEALWSLLLPITVHGRVTDIWRAYLAQRLMCGARQQKSSLLGFTNGVPTGLRPLPVVLLPYISHTSRHLPGGTLGCGSPSRGRG